MMITASGPPCRSRGRGDTGGHHRRLPPSSTSPPPEQTAGNRAAARKASAGPSFSLEGAGRCPRPRPVGGGDGAAASALASGRWAGRAEATGCGTVAAAPDLASLARSGGPASSRDDGGTQGGGEGRCRRRERWSSGNARRLSRSGLGEWSAPRRCGDRQAGAASRWSGDNSGGSLPPWSRRRRRRLSSVGVGFGNAAAARSSWSSPVPGWIWLSAAGSIASTPNGSWSAGRLRVDGKRCGGSLAASLLLGRGLLPVVGLVVVDGQRCADVEMAGRRLVLA
uniref:Uncharacterized protein n=1 Tax=Oryza nivara TaxID=4536 RepID=A0A0E0H5Q1_ORYNI